VRVLVIEDDGDPPVIETLAQAGYRIPA